MKDIEQYIQIILSRSKLPAAEKDEMYSELFDHLMSLKNEHLEKGLTEQKAIQAAISEFGDPKKLANEIHKSKHPFQKYILLTSWFLFIPYAVGIIWLFLIYNRLGVLIPNIYFTIDTIQEIGVLAYLKTSINIVPFKTILMYLMNFNSYNLDTWLLNTVANVVLFIPFGFFAPILFKTVFNFQQAILLFIKTVLVIEIIQFVSLTGVFDIDDIILNVAGACIGYATWNLISKGYLERRNNNPLKTM